MPARETIRVRSTIAGVRQFDAVKTGELLQSHSPQLQLNLKPRLQVFPWRCGLLAPPRCYNAAFDFDYTTTETPSNQNSTMITVGMNYKVLPGKQAEFEGKFAAVLAALN